MTRSIILGILLCFTAAVSQSQVKTPRPPAEAKPFSASLQALVVTTDGWDAVSGTARLFERSSADSKWRPAGERFPVVVGRSGMGSSPGLSLRPGDQAPVKHEGDGRSPAGLFPLTFAFGSKTVPQTRLPYTELVESTECVDDVASSHYNTMVDRMKVGNFDWKSSEKMLEVGEPYERGVFVAYNSNPPVKGSGSCIFLHIWKDAATGTSGCTAMQRSDLETLLKRLDPAKGPYLVQLPKDEYIRNSRSWNLPKLK